VSGGMAVSLVWGGYRGHNEQCRRLTCGNLECEATYAVGKASTISQAVFPDGGSFSGRLLWRLKSWEVVLNEKQ